MTNSEDERRLIRLAQKGDLDAFNQLVLSHQSRLYNVAFRIMGEHPAAADATQEAFIAAFRKVRSFRGGSFRAWLHRILTNQCYDEFRRQKRRPATSLESMTQDSNGIDLGAQDPSLNRPELPEQAAERADLSQAIQDCLNRLPLDFRTVAILSDIQGFNYREIAQVIGKPLGTVKSRLARARERLRDCLKGYGELLPVSYRQEDEALA
jgi:RNA polymerase sigma-70 factor (ECF subfamily)